MTNFDFVRVFPVYPKYFSLQWELIGAGIPGPYRFKVFRSSSPTANFEPISDWLENTYNFTDPDPAIFTRTLQVYYRIDGYNPLNEFFQSKAVSTFNQPEKRILLMAKEIVRRQDLLFNKFNGVEIAVLKRKMWGPACPVCISSSLGAEVTNSSCTTCYGTGKAGGYFPPISIRGHFEPTPVTNRESTETGMNDVREMQARISNTPLLRARDILVEKHNNNRWWIKTVELTEMQRYPVSQLILVSMIDRSDIIYEFPID